MKKSNKIIISALGVAVVTTLTIGFCQGKGVSETVGAGDDVTGNGNMATQTSTVPMVRKVYVNGKFDLTILQGNTNTLVLTADQNILPLLTVTTKHNALQLGTKPDTSFSSEDPIKAVLTESSVNAVTLNGKTSLHMAGINVNAFTLTMNGKSSSDISGNMKNLQLELSGKTNVAANVNHADSINLTASGKTNAHLAGTANNLVLVTAGNVMIDAKNLSATNASITGMGRSDITVRVATHLSVNSIGSSSISYYGNPTVEKHGFGKSSVQQMGQ